ncbi:Serine/threonine-protein kinase RIO1 [Porphyridium purpureum]|uniref:Serine/threonine-protein kinase RIO1 n=1 Tax=Porphyridium purpureum TaxID=35688 RepID=A0A5J4YPC2_PORPP|nr:Serine/threonine-protein kinase RIO1 [Porphyridium purpureum]|eukprot:POR8009..scf295_9
MASGTACDMNGGPVKDGSGAVAAAEALTQRSSEKEFEDSLGDDDNDDDDNEYEDEDFGDEYGSEGRGGGAGSNAGVAVQKGKEQRVYAENVLVEFERGQRKRALAGGGKERADRATVEQAIDPRTRLILFRLLSNGVISGLHGCVSTGKEANVYVADHCGRAEAVAVKVYKTAVLTFKDRDRYVAGEFRFRRGYNKHNSRKMVAVWAEKEFRNLSRLQLAGVPSPVPLLLRSTVLLMTFFGRDGWPAPKLKDVSLSQRRAVDAYRQTLFAMRNMYQRAKLVHGDLSEYNMLYWNDTVVIIDVSQSVEHDHPHALDFLRRDCLNVTNFFRGIVSPDCAVDEEGQDRESTRLLGVRELFDFVSDVTLSDTMDQREALDKRMTLLPTEARSSREQEAQAEIETAVFMHAFIPRTLHEVEDHERDIDMIAEGRGSDLLYTKLTGLVLEDTTEGHHQTSQSAELPVADADEANGEVLEVRSAADREPCSGDEYESHGLSGESAQHSSESESRHSHQDGGQGTRKDHKKLVKEWNRERRKSKTPKHVKKRKEKTNKK